MNKTASLTQDLGQVETILNEMAESSKWSQPHLRFVRWILGVAGIRPLLFL